MLRFILLYILFIINPEGGKLMEITCPNFKEGAMIPKKYTCDDVNVSPPLSWSKAPEGTKTFAIIFDDPDAPMGTWVHWVMYNIPFSTHSLPEHVPPIGQLPTGARQGKNDFGKIGYGGPCPPRGIHRYYFKIYALSGELVEGPGLTKSQLLKTMKDKILAEGQLMGRYER